MSVAKAYLRSFAFSSYFHTLLQIVFGDSIELDGITRHLVPCFAHLFYFFFFRDRARPE